MIAITKTEFNEDMQYKIYFSYAKEIEDDNTSMLHIKFKTINGTWSMDAWFDIIEMPWESKTFLTATNSDFDVKEVNNWGDVPYPSNDNLLQCLNEISMKYGVDLLERVAQNFYGNNAVFIGFHSA